MTGYGAHVVLMAMAIVTITIANAQDPYGLSLVKPFQRDNWNLLGNPKFEPNSLVLTSGSRPGPQRAAIWNTNPFPYRQAFNVTLRTKIGSANTKKPEVKTGKGLGLWLLEMEDGKPIGALGDVYGSTDYFRGLGIIFDSIDDDNLRNNPAISGHYLDGTTKYSHGDDGIQHQLAGCRVDYRRGEGVVATQVIYDGSNLSVYVDLGGGKGNQKCFSKPLKMRTDRPWYLGVSAETIASQVTQEVHEIVSLDVTGTPDWGARATQQQATQQQQWQQQQQQQWQQPPQQQQQQQWQQQPPQQQQNQWKPPQQQQQQQQQQQPPAASDDAADTLHEKIDQLMRATTHTALESQQAGEALKEVQTNVLQKIQQQTNSLGRQIRSVDSSLAQHMNNIAQQYDSLAKAIESTKGSVDAGRVDAERRINAIDAQISTLQDTVKSMNGVVERLSKSFQAQISREFGKGTARLAAAANKRSDWSIWAFIILFQFVFVAFLMYRSLMKKKLDKLL